MDPPSSITEPEITKFRGCGKPVVSVADLISRKTVVLLVSRHSGFGVPVIMMAHPTVFIHGNNMTSCLVQAKTGSYSCQLSHGSFPVVSVLWLNSIHTDSTSLRVPWPWNSLTAE